MSTTTTTTGTPSAVAPTARRRGGGRPARRTGRPPLTDAAAILGAARELGFDGLTVGAVTAKVGVKYSTFYRHYPSLSSLVAAMVDAVLDETGWPSIESPWRDHLTELTATMTDVVVTHPGFAAAVASRPELPPRLHRACADAAELLRDAGADEHDAGLTARGVSRAVLAIDLPPFPPTENGERSSDDERRAEVAAFLQLTLDGLKARLGPGSTPG